MTRPTRPPGQPYPDDEEPPEAGQPRFTPRQSGPQPPYEAPHEPPTYQGTPPYGMPPPPPGPHQASPGYDPYPPPPPEIGRAHV